LTTTEDRPPISLKLNGPDYLLSRGVPTDDVEQLLCGFWLIMTGLMDQVPIARAGPNYQDDVGIAELGELMAYFGAPLNVIPEGLALLLLATLQILGVARLHACDLKVAGEDFFEILPAIN
jgi:hypothetical protein